MFKSKVRSLGLVMTYALLLTAVGSYARQVSSIPISLWEAEQIALKRDPGIGRFDAQAEAFSEQAVAGSQLPDPKIKFGLVNFPTDTFNRTQEPMTQVQVGVQQRIPRGNSLAVKARRAQALSGVQRYLASNQGRKTLQQVRLSWLELYYWLGAERVVRNNQGLFAQLVEVTQYQYAVGKHNQQAVIRAELELGLLDDRLQQIGAHQDKSRAELERWIGPRAANRSMSPEFPNLPLPPDRDVIETQLTQHPLLQSEQAKVTASQESVELAREAYKPEWMVGVTYGFRGGQNVDGRDRPDFLSALVTVDLPVFRNKRQDRALAAGQRELEAARLARDERVLEFRQVLDAHYAELNRLRERNRLYNTTLLSQAEENAKAALIAYQNDTAAFSELIRARITELDTQLKALRIRVEQAKIQAKLLYLWGGDHEPK